MWWRFTRPASELYAAITDQGHAIVMPLVSKVVLPLVYPTGAVFSHAVAVIATEKPETFGVLTSVLHRTWARKCGSSLETRTRYTPSDCFETFPFPHSDSIRIAEVMQRLDQHRREMMLSLSLGLTKLYNRVHNPTDRDTAVETLREMHVELDHAVRDAYGWADLDLAYGFHETNEGMRWTIAPPILIEILDRLLDLNHERHAEEVAGGRTKPTARNGKTKRTSSKANIGPSQLSLTDSI